MLSSPLVRIGDDGQAFSGTFVYCLISGYVTSFCYMHHCLPVEINTKTNCVPQDSKVLSLGQEISE